MRESRTRNSERNIVTGLVQKGIGILLPFINRTVILWILGAEYQGLSSLFSSILQVLNMAELGMSSAIVYSMYKPIAEGDEEKVNALLNYFRKAYYIIGLCILCVGLLLLPFLPYLINGSVPGDMNIYVLYCLYLVNTVISYFFFAYKNTVFQAHQRSDVTNNIQSAVKVAECIVQFFILIIFKNYYLYVIIVPVFTLVNNLLVRSAVNRMYPQYAKPYGGLDSESKGGLKKQISGLMINKLSDTARNSFDSIIISSLFGLVTVAVYSNYYYVYSSLYAIMLVVTNSMGASIGDSIASEGVEKNYNDCRKLTFLFAWLSGWFSICMFCLYQPFMRLWVGEDLMLSFVNMACFCLYFYLINANNIRNLYVSGNGLWWKLKTIYIAEAVCNLVLNIGLGYLLGVFGVLLATILTIFIFNFVGKSHVLFHNYFVEQSEKGFFLSHLGYFCVTLANAVVCYWACSFVTFDGIGGLFLKALVCVVVPNVFYLLCYCKTNIFKVSMGWLKDIAGLRRLKN